MEPGNERSEPTPGESEPRHRPPISPLQVLILTVVGGLSINLLSNRVDALVWHDIWADIGLGVLAVACVGWLVWLQYGPDWLRYRATVRTASAPVGGRLARVPLFPGPVWLRMWVLIPWAALCLDFAGWMSFEDVTHIYLPLFVKYNAGALTFLVLQLLDMRVHKDRENYQASATFGTSMKQFGNWTMGIAPVNFWVNLSSSRIFAKNFTGAIDTGIQSRIYYFARHITVPPAGTGQFKHLQTEVFFHAAAVNLIFLTFAALLIACVIKIVRKVRAAGIRPTEP